MGRKTDCFHFLKFSAIKRISCEIETSEAGGEEGQAEHIDEMIQDVLAEVNLVSFCVKMLHVSLVSSLISIIRCGNVRIAKCVYVMSTLYLATLHSTLDTCFFSEYYSNINSMWGGMR